MRELLSASAALMLKLRAWAVSPASESECRFSLLAALKKLRPVDSANEGLYEKVEAATIRLQSLL